MNLMTLSSATAEVPIFFLMESKHYSVWLSCKLLPASHVCGLTFLVQHISLSFLSYLTFFIGFGHAAAELFLVICEDICLFKIWNEFQWLCFLSVCFSQSTFLALYVLKRYLIVFSLLFSQRCWFSFPWYTWKEESNVCFDFLIFPSALKTVW